MLRYTIDRARPGLVALYDIRPGNGAVNSYNPGARTGPIKGKVTFYGSTSSNHQGMPSAESLVPAAQLGFTASLRQNLSLFIQLSSWQVAGQSQLQLHISKLFNNIQIMLSIITVSPQLCCI